MRTPSHARKLRGPQRGTTGRTTSCSPGQLALLAESQQDATERAARPPVETPPTPYALPVLAHEFLTHLANGRRCSPRTVEAYRADYTKVARLLQAAGHDLDVRRISAGDLQVCLAGLRHLAPASVERLVYALRSLFGYLVRKGLVSQNPATEVDRPRKSRSLPLQFTTPQVDALLRAAQTVQERVLVALLAYGGLRRAEVLGLDLSDVAADLTSLRVAGKGGKSRSVPLHPDLQGLLREHLAELPADGAALIRNQAGGRMSTTTFARRFRRLLTRAGLAGKPLSPHKLRHYFASTLVRAGTDIATVADLLGHSSISTTSIYLHTNGATKREAIGRLPTATEALCAGTPGSVAPPSLAAAALAGGEVPARAPP